MYSTLKRRGNDRFHVVSTRNTRGVFVEGGFNMKRNTGLKWVNFCLSISHRIKSLEKASH